MVDKPKVTPDEQKPKDEPELLLDAGADEKTETTPPEAVAPGAPEVPADLTGHNDAADEPEAIPEDDAVKIPEESIEPITPLESELPTEDEADTTMTDPDPEVSDQPAQNVSSNTSDGSSSKTSSSPSSADSKSSFKTPEEAAKEDEQQPSPVVDGAAVIPPIAAVKKGNWFKRHKKMTILLVLIIVIAALAAVPWTRYKIAGTFLRQTQVIEVLDSQTNQPVTGASVYVDNRLKITDSKGKVSIEPKVGTRTVTVQKPNFTISKTEQLIPILKPKTPIAIHIKATGRQVGVKVINSITGKPIENADFKIDGSQFKTNDKGLATIVAPADSKKISATVSAANYLQAKSTLLVTANTTQMQTFKLTPVGKLYFLSNLSGKIDVVKSNLDGSNRQTVLAGTGSEDQHGTALLASRDWKYLVLLSRRDGGNNDKVFLINTATDKVTTVDEGNASFTLVGWHDHSFVYSVFRNDKKLWDSQRQALKSYNAETGKLTTLDQSDAVGQQSGFGYQTLGNFYIVNSGVMYTTTWDSGGSSFRGDILKGKENSIRTINVDGSSKKDIKTFDAVSTGYMNARLYAPNQIYVSVYDYDKNGNSFYEFEDGAVKVATNANDNTFNQAYPTFLVSPSGNQTFWSDNRDGKNSLFVGDKDAKNPQQIASLSDYSAYGWFTDNYVLASKNGSELYIMSKSGGNALKVTDYYKPNLNFSGYGYGYGGL